MSPDAPLPTQRRWRAASAFVLPLAIASLLPCAVQADTAQSARSAAFEAQGADVIGQYCQGCHRPGQADDGSPHYSRISDQRKTPEGWRMTINRMIHLRGVPLPEDKIEPLVAYLSATQGLAPSEAAPHRYLLEQDTNLVESGFDAEFEQMCARCHSGARVALQRRTEQEWQYLVNFHMGQFPTTELHAYARDRAWYQIAHDELAPVLAERYPLESAAWHAWLAADRPSVEGRWRVVGHLPERGDYAAWMTASALDDGSLTLTLEGHTADGQVLSGSGSARLYSGYEWRAELELDGSRWRQVMALQTSPADHDATAIDSERMHGRMYRDGQRALGGELSATRVDDEAELVAVWPGHLRQGESLELTLIGAGLDGEPDLGPGIEVLEVLEQGGDRLRLKVTASADATLGQREVGVGNARLAKGLVVYDRLARLEVVPANAVSRIGGSDGPLAKVPVVYRAVGYAAGPDGEAGTADDLRLGYMQADWSIAPADEAAEHEQDVEFAGAFDAHGVFIPGNAGPNPERPKSANNVGRLKAVATVSDGDDTITGEGRLVVAVQDYVERVLD